MVGRNWNGANIERFISKFYKIQWLAVRIRKAT